MVYLLKFRQPVGPGRKFVCIDFDAGATRTDEHRLKRQHNHKRFNPDSKGQAACYQDSR